MIVIKKYYYKSYILIYFLRKGIGIEQHTDLPITVKSHHILDPLTVANMYLPNYGGSCKGGSSGS